MGDFISPDDEEEEEALIAEIEQEMRKIYSSVEKLYNNASLSELNDPVDTCFIRNYNFASSLLERGISDEADGRDLLKIFEENLQRELDFLSNDLDKLLMKMNEHKEQLQSLDRNISNLNAMIDDQNNKIKTEKNLKVAQNVRIRFMKEKSELKSLVASLFQDNLEIQDIIAQVVDHHFSEGSDKYFQVEKTDNITEQVELLRRTRLFEVNPHDPLQIRLIDLL